MDEDTKKVFQKSLLPPTRRELMRSPFTLKDLKTCISYVRITNTHPIYTSSTFLCLSCISLSLNKMECPYFRLRVTEAWEIYARTYYSYFYRVNYIFTIFIMHLLKAHYMLSSDRMKLYRQFVLNVSFPFKARRKVSYSYSKDFLSTVISHHVSVQHCEKCSWSVINSKFCNKYGFLHRISHWII